MNDNYCAAVDTGLFIYPGGQVGVCCAGSEYLGNVNKESIQHIFQKPRFIEIRNNLKNNIEDKYCSGCNQLEKLAPNSSQKFAFNDGFGIQKQRHLRLIDIRWSNVCNLSCRYCNINDSSEWRKLAHLPQINVNKDYVESIFQEVNNNKETISNVYLLGGEPLLQKHNERLLDIVDRNVKIDVLTNLSVKLENNKIYEKLKSMPHVLWNISFDNVGKRFEYVRHGADWQIFKDNIRRVQDDFGRHRLTFHPVYTLWNATNLLEYYEFAYVNSARVNWQLALPKTDLNGYRTDSFIVFGHKQNIIEQAINEIDKLNIKDDLLKGLQQILVDSVEVQGKNIEFLQWTARMENLMPPVDKFQNLWPSLFKLLNV
jgi:organic radical activating enzyme